MQTPGLKRLMRHLIGQLTTCVTCNAEKYRGKNEDWQENN